MVDLSQLRFTENHEWIRGEGNKWFVGITDYAQKEITDVVFVELPPIGKEIKAGEEVMTIESVKAVFSIYAPASGKIVEVNQRLQDDPALINNSPYEEGWIFAIEFAHSEEVTNLMDHQQYQEFVSKGE